VPALIHMHNALNSQIVSHICSFRSSVAGVRACKLMLLRQMS